MRRVLEKIKGLVTPTVINCTFLTALPADRWDVDHSFSELDEGASFDWKANVSHKLEDVVRQILENIIYLRKKQVKMAEMAKKCLQKTVKATWNVLKYL